jgi:uncharacterized DUF497 family protein
MFVWDDAKDTVNRVKHGIGFDAARDFDSVVEFDCTCDADGENHFAMVGYLYGRLHIMIYTEREAVIRIISLRRSNKKEERLYETRKNIEA